MSGSVVKRKIPITAPETVKRIAKEEPILAPEATVTMTEPQKIQARNAFWTTLWHVDIFKDHKAIEEAVVNKFLPNNGEYGATVDQTWDEGASKVVISEKDKTGHRGIVPYTNTADTLFNFLIPKLGEALPFTIEGKPFVDWSCATLQAAAPETWVTDLQVNPQISNSKYDIKVFKYRDEEGTTKINVDELKAFMGGHKLLLTVDTSVDLTHVIGKYNPGDPGDLIYAYTREIENDAASKINFKSSDKEPYEELFKKRYYTEKVTSEGGLNPTVITYPPYTENDPMSYFYCKYPVCLKCEGAGADDTKKTLRTSLFYMKGTKTGTKTIIIPDGANKAKGFEKAKENLLSAFGFRAKSEDMLEAVYISKHHGDIAQTMVKNRNIVLTSANGGPVVNSQDYKNVFVSIDMNACSKAFTLDADFVWMYTADKTRLVVWKNQRLTSPESMFPAKVQQYNSMYEKLQRDIESYNVHVGRILTEKAEFDAYVGSFVKLSDSEIAAAARDADTVAATAKSKKEKDPLVRIYIEYIKKGIQIAILSTFIPTEAIVRIEPLPPILTFAGIEAVEEAIKALQVKRDSLPLSSGFEKISLFDATGNLRGVSVEKTLSFVKEGTTITQQKLDNIWESINLHYKPGDKTFAENLLCRNGTRFNTSWGLDIILSIHRRLALYNPGYSRLYIKKLYTLFVPKSEKQKNFYIGLNILGLTDGITRTSGGTRKRRTLRGGAVTETTQTRTSSVRPSNRPSTVSHLTLQVRTYEDDFILAVDDMLSDMYEHLLFLNTIRYETDNLKVLEAFDRCMFNIHGIHMSSDIFRRLYYRGQIGGDDEEEVLQMITQTIEAAEGKEGEEAALKAALEAAGIEGEAAGAGAAAAAAAAGAGAVAGTEGAAVEVTTEAEYQLFQEGDTFATLYSEYEQYVQVLINLKNHKILTRITKISVKLKNYVLNKKEKPSKRTREVVITREQLIQDLEDLLEELNSEEMKGFEYKKKDGTIVKIDKDGLTEPNARAGAGAGTVAGAAAGTVAGVVAAAAAAGVPRATRSQKPPLVPGLGGGFRRRTYKKKRM